MIKNRFHWQYVLGAVSLLALVASAPAQQDEPSVSVFSPVAQASLKHLGALAQLPAADWRYHKGDIPHGEDPALDDSGWQPIHDGNEAAKESAWFRRKIVFPKDLDGYNLQHTGVLFHFEASIHGPLPQIVYLNGRRIALGDDLEPFVIFEDAKPGDVVNLAVKLPRTDDVKHFRTPLLQLVFAPQRPSPEDLRVELLSVSALLPSQQELLNKAATSINWTALQSGNQQVFDQSLKQAHEMLLPLQAQMKHDHIDLVGNSHIDAAWLWPLSETTDVVKRTFGTSLQLMSEYPNYKFTQSAAAYSQWMQEKYPFLWDELKQRVNEKRWEIVGGMWVEPDLNMPDGESIVRQLLVGTRYFKQALGVDVHIGWNPDSFGYNWQLPQIYRRSGIDYFVTQKMKWNETNQLPLKFFWWQSPDGSKVLTYFPHDYARDTKPLRLTNDLAAAQKLAPGTDHLMHLYGVGDHGGGPTRVMLDQATHWMDEAKVYPQQTFTLAQTALDQLKSEINPSFTSPIWNYRTLIAGNTTLPPSDGGAINIPTWNDELYLEFHRGVFTSQAQHKRHMREGEEALLNSEKYASIAWLGGSPYPADSLTEGWKHVLFNQFHDLAAGSGNAATFKDAERDFDATRAITDKITAASLHTLDEHIKTDLPGGATPLIVFNPLAWPRTDTVEADLQLAHPGNDLQILDPQGKPVPFQILTSNPKLGTYHILLRTQIPAMGYALLSASTGNKQAPSDLKATRTTLENSAIRVEIDPATGCITHLIDKKTSFDSIAPNGCGNQLQTFHDLPKQYDAWNIDESALATMQPISTVDSVELADHGPLKASIRIKRHWQSSQFVQEISLTSGADTVEIANDIDWHEEHVLLKAAFPLAASAPMAAYEIPYGAIDRPTTRTNSIDKAKFEVPALRWADLGDNQHGLSLLNESKYGYDTTGNVMRLSLLRAPTYPDPDADRGHHHFVYALYPHTGPWKQADTMHRGYELNYKLAAWQSTPHTGTLPAQASFFAVETPGVTLTAIKKAEDSNALLLRFFEWQGTPHKVRIRLPITPTHAEQTNLMEKPSDGAVAIENNAVSLDIKPYEILTIRLDFPTATDALWQTRPLR